MKLQVDGRLVEITATHSPTGFECPVVSIAGQHVQLVYPEKTRRCIRCGKETDCSFPIVNIGECNFHIE